MLLAIQIIPRSSFRIEVNSAGTTEYEPKSREFRAIWQNGKTTTAMQCQWEQSHAKTMTHSFLFVLKSNRRVDGDQEKKKQRNKCICSTANRQTKCGTEEKNNNNPGIAAARFIIIIFQWYIFAICLSTHLSLWKHFDLFDISVLFFIPLPFFMFYKRPRNGKKKIPFSKQEEKKKSFPGNVN